MTAAFTAAAMMPAAKEIWDYAFSFKEILYLISWDLSVNVR
jgi:hypothetical protein